MLPLALLALLGVTIYSVLKAPEELRSKAIFWMTLPPIVGFGLLYFLSADDTRVYYGLAGAIGSWVVGSNIYDAQRKKLNKKKGFDHE